MEVMRPGTARCAAQTARDTDVTHKKSPSLEELGFGFALSSSLERVHAECRCNFLELQAFRA